METLQIKPYQAIAAGHLFASKGDEAGLKKCIDVLMSKKMQKEAKNLVDLYKDMWEVELKTRYATLRQ